MMPWYTLNFSTHNNLISNLLREKKKNKILAFLDVCNKDPFCLLTPVHRKKAFAGLLTNFFSFTSYSYKIGLIRTIADRAYKINNTLAPFNDDV